MPYTDHYEKYLNEIPGNIEKCKETGDRIVLVTHLIWMFFLHIMKTSLTNW